jgi:hypothetical protein
MTQAVLSPVTSPRTDRAPDPIEYLANIRTLRDEFFSGEWHYIVRPNHANSSWVTCSQYPLSVGGFVNKFADPLNLLGVSFGDITNYLGQDIDIRSPYHPANDPQEFNRFLDTLEKIGLTAPVIIQSSDSGGVHVYYFLDRPLSTIRIATLVKVTSIDANFHIKDGDLELFPNVKKYTSRGEKPSHFKALRLPLQPNSGAMILDRDGNISEWANITPQKQIEIFLEMAIESAATNDIDLIEKKLDPAYKKYTKKIDKYQELSGSKNLSPRALEWKENLETEFEIGWTGNGQTNDLLRKFVEYAIVFEQITDRDEICKRVLERVLITRGYHEHCRHQPTIEDRIADWVDSNLKTTYSVPYCAMPPRRGGEYPSGSTRPTSGSGTGVNQHNIATADRAFQRFLDVMDLVTEIPNRIGDLIGMICDKSKQIFGEGFSNATLYKEKYRAIWIKLFSTKNTVDLVPLLANLGGEVCNNPETHTENELELVNFQLENNALESLEPTIGETSPTLNDYGRLFTGTDGYGDELVATGSSSVSNSDPHLINSLPYSLSESIELEIENLSTSPSQLGVSVIPDSIDSDNESPIHLTFRDRVQLLDSSDPEHKIGIVFRVVGSIATVLWDATNRWIDYPFSELRMIDRYSDRLNPPRKPPIDLDRVFLQIDDRVRPTDPYGVHGAHMGIVTAIVSWGIYVGWQDGSIGSYGVDELVAIDPKPT